MITLAPENPLAKSVEFANGVMRVALEDGRRLEAGGCRSGARRSGAFGLLCPLRRAG